MVAESQTLPLPFILWQHGDTAPPHTQLLQLCKLLGAEENSVASMSMCGLQMEHGDSLEMQAGKEDAEE